MPIVTFGFSLLGLSETLSVVAVFSAGLLTVPFLFLVWESIDTRRMRRSSNWQEEFVHPDGPLTAGVVLVDFVDEQGLVSIAKQKGIEPEPNRRERTSSTTRGGDVGGGTGGLRARHSRQRQQSESETFDVEKDPNTMLAAVLVRLERDGELDRHLAHVPPLTLDDATLERIRDVASDEPEQAALTGLRDRLIAADMRRAFATAAESGTFLLAESDWTVTLNGDRVTLTLDSLRPPFYAYDSRSADLADVKPVPVPEGVSLVAQVRQSQLTDRGQARLEPGARVRAGVLSTIGDYDHGNGELELSAIAVFGRYGRPRDVGGTFVAGC